jgi:hypothetical protein
MALRPTPGPGHRGQQQPGRSIHDSAEMVAVALVGDADMESGLPGSWSRPVTAPDPDASPWTSRPVIAQFVRCSRVGLTRLRTIRSSRRATTDRPPEHLSGTTSAEPILLQGTTMPEDRRCG